jgi:predicted acylesterase/phospholipase RssA
VPGSMPTRWGARVWRRPGISGCSWSGTLRDWTPSARSPGALRTRSPCVSFSGYRVGLIHNATIELAVAVAASSAFPPVLSPLKLELDPSSWAPASGEPSEDLHKEPYLSVAVLTDGGVYDNLGLETAWKRYKTVLVSNGGGKMQPEEEPHTDWAPTRDAYQ